MNSEIKWGMTRGKGKDNRGGSNRRGNRRGKFRRRRDAQAVLGCKLKKRRGGGGTERTLPSKEKNETRGGRRF